MGLDGLYVKKVPAKFKNAGTFSGSHRAETQASHHSVFFPLSSPISPVRNQEVSGPADRDGTPHHGDSEAGGTGHGNNNADGQVDQIGDGEHDHITGAAQETIYRHFKTNYAEEPSHESEIAFAGVECLSSTV